MTALVFAEQDGGVLAPETAHVVTAARRIDPEVQVVVAGAASAAEQAAQLSGVGKVVAVEAPPYAHYLAEPTATYLAALAGPYATVVAAATAHAKAILPRAAMLCDRPMLSEIVAVLDAETFERPIHAGTILETVRCRGNKFVSIRPTAFAPAGRQAPAPIVAAPSFDDPGLTQFLEADKAAPTDRPDLATAKIVVAGGRGVASKEGFAILEGLANRLHAAVGASRAAVDAGYAPNACQIGQSGRTIAPDLYIAVGISGAIQHVAGIRDAKVIAAVNKDPDAPIFRMADIGLVGDLFAVLPVLEAELAKRTK